MKENSNKNKTTPKKSVAKISAKSNAKANQKGSLKAVPTSKQKTPVKTTQTPPVRTRQSAVQPHLGSLNSSTAKPAAGNLKRRKKGKYAAPVKVIAFSLALLIIGFAAAVKIENVKFSNVSDAFLSIAKIFSPGKGYPYEISGADKTAFNLIGSNMLITNQGSINVLNSTAKETFSSQNTFTNPAIEVCNGRAVVFDRESGAFKVISRTNVLFEKDIEQNILAAAIGKKGNYAIAAESKTATSELSVYNTKKEQIFAWLCEAERISAVALSNNGKSAAVSVVGSKDGELYSKLHIFDFDKKEPVVSFDYPETALIQVRFTDKHTAVAVGDSLMSVVSIETKKKQDVAYESNTLHRLFMHESGKTALVLATFGSTGKNELKVYGSNGALLFEKTIEQEITWVSCDKLHTSVLLGDEIQSFNNKGESAGTVKLDGDAEKIFLTGKTIYFVSEGKINRYPNLGEKV